MIGIFTVEEMAVAKSVRKFLETSLGLDNSSPPSSGVRYTVDMNGSIRLAGFRTVKRQVISARRRLLVGRELEGYGGVSLNSNGGAYCQEQGQPF